jgi:hypothetical protein
MNIYSLLNIEHNTNLNVPDAKTIETILNDVISTKLIEYGLNNSSKKYIWQGDYNEVGIKPILQFSYRGTRGSFWIGMNFKFVPFITKNKALRYYSYNPHLFESKSYFDKKTGISLWNENFFRKSLQMYFDKNLKAIIKFFNKFTTIEANIELAKRQIKSNNFVYRHRFPHQEFVLVYLLNNAKKTEEMKRLMNSFLKEHNNYDESIFSSIE